MKKTYACEICHGVNHVSRVTCEYCGTIPSRYSPIAKPINAVSIQVTAAFGCERIEHYRSVKNLLRTVPLDYYAERE